MKAINRVVKLIEKQQLTNSAFEKKVGLSNGYISKQYARNADLGESILIKILDNCPKINALWLLTGKGEMLKDSDDANNVEVYEAPVSYSTLNEIIADKKRIIELLEAENAYLKQLLAKMEE